MSQENNPAPEQENASGTKKKSLLAETDQVYKAYIVKVFLIAASLGYIATLIDRNNYGTFVHPYVMFVAILYPYVLGPHAMRAKGWNLAYKGSKGKGMFARWYWKQTVNPNGSMLQFLGVLIHLLTSVAYIMYLMNVIYDTVHHYQYLNETMPLMKYYFFLTVSLATIAVNWFACFLICSSKGFIRIAETEAETYEIYRKTEDFIHKEYEAKREKKEKERAEREAAKKQATATIPTKTSPAEKGRTGEKEVDYNLKWWDTLSRDNDGSLRCTIIRKDCKSTYSEECIRLAAPTAANGEPQEFDHILVTSYGVISIETKTFAGSILVENEGAWRINGKLYESPNSQVKRHDLVLKNILAEIPITIHSFICIADPGTEIIGAEKSSIPIFSIRDLEPQLNSVLYSPDAQYVPEKIYSEAVRAIEQAKVGKQQRT